ncbi:polyprenol monophosphomannose synthase [Propioniferax innocua]|uniref:Dolichol-phosphate mannosyltransferase n=1 Tax=Propioniferax innocua TaxID=1753 RepID=A0A542ZQ53_9ACTN|nr:dolichol-phosphate mannosyltransferase [Propioniferax innocua]
MDETLTTTDSDTTTESPLGTVLVIIPTFNERENIPLITARLRAAVPNAHILVADDNSPDGTGEIADELAENDENVHVLHREGKQGLGAAYIAGFAWGLENGYGVLVEHDADGSHQPEQLPDLLAALENADMVKGSRYVKGGSTVNWPKYREMISRCGGLWTWICLGINIKDPTGGFNAFRAATLRAIDFESVQSAGYCFQIDLTWRTISRGMKVVEVPIEFKEREFGTSKMNQSIILEAFWQVAKWGAEHRVKQIKGLFKRR